jgi:nitrite reductase/ring-hydroxylating ferredoxin subunit
MSSRLVPVARLSDLRESRARRVVVEDHEIVLWNIGGRVFATTNVCSHQHVAALHEGILEGLTISCPMHGWTYSLETGIAVRGDGRIRVYTVTVTGNDVFVEIPETTS